MLVTVVLLLVLMLQPSPCKPYLEPLECPAFWITQGQSAADVYVQNAACFQQMQTDAW